MNPIEELRALAASSPLAPLDPKAADDKSAFSLSAEICRRLQIDVLGEWPEDQSIEIFSYNLKKLRRVRDFDRIKMPRLLQLCGEQAERHINPGMAPIPDKFTLGQIRQAVCTMAGRRELDSDSVLGTGCWRGRDEDGNETSSVVIVNAKEYAVWNGEMRLERIVHPRCGGLLLQISNRRPWVDFSELAKFCNDAADPTWCKAVFEAVARELGGPGRWRWRQPHAPCILAGLVAATWIQSLWEWRPQVSIIGETNTGKSLLFDTLPEMFGRMSAKLARSSTARGLAQTVGQHSRVLMVDEWDRIPEKRRPEIFSLIRESGRGEECATGRPSQVAKITFLKNIWWTAGITSNLEEPADRNRFIIFELVPAAAGQHGKLRTSPASELRKLGMAMLAIAVRYGVAAVRLADEMKGTQVENIHPRFVESFAAPAAIEAAACGMSRDDGESLLREYLEAVGQDGVIDRDDDELMHTILASIIDAGRELGRKSVAQLVEIVRDVNANSQHAFDSEEALAKVGVAVRRDEITRAEILIVAHNVASRHLLAATPWSGRTIREILARASGAVEGVRKIGGINQRCFSIPTDSESLNRYLGGKQV
jgi:hypothetical protein